MSSDTGVQALAELDRDALEARVTELENEREQMWAVIERLQDRIEEIESGKPDPDTNEDLCTLEVLSKQVPVEDREDAISPSDRRAIAIFENWWDLARKTQKGWVVDTKRNSTKKENPSQFRLDLNGICGEDLEWVQVYRAMKAVAELSGGETIQDEYDRTHVQDGAFEYHEKVTPDGNSTYKLLRLADENSLTLL